MSASSSRRRVRVALGAIFVVGGLVGAVVLWNAGSQRRSSAIENYARAPIGCDTTLDFAEPGEYLLFVETTGSLDEVRGDCEVQGAFDNADGDVPDVDITLVDPDGDDIDVDRSSGDVEYDADGFRGVAQFSVDIEARNDHVLRAESDVDVVVVVAVGRDPNEGVVAFRTGAVAAGVGGLLAGLVFLFLGVRRSTTAVPAGPWTPGVAPRPGGFVPGGPAPQGPPVYGHATGNPVYGQPPQYGQPPGSSPQYARPGLAAGQPAPPPPLPPPPPPGQAAPPSAPAPQFDRPLEGGQQPPQPQQSPPPQQPPPPVPGHPDIPGQPAFPRIPSDPAENAQPIDWAPGPTSSQPPGLATTSPPDEDFSAQRPEEPSTDERPPPPPPE